MPVPYDPLAHLRTPQSPAFDVYLQGMVFLDIVFTGMPSMPRPGEEIWAEGMGSSPGGIANLAVAAARLGLKTSLGAAFGDDDYGEFCWRTLEQQEHVDLRTSRRYPGWHSPVTVSLAVDHDRSMVTHGHEPPETASVMIGHPPRSRAVLLDLSPLRPIGDDTEPTWADVAREEGSLLFADVGFDPSGLWPHTVLDQLRYCHAFLPNAAEAMAYTRTSTPQDALYALADLVPLAVVTNGAQGALAIDSLSGEEAIVPALRVRAVDATGAGDVFAAAVTLGTLAGWPLAQRLSFAALCSSLAVQEVGGSLAAPGWGDIADWWHRLSASGQRSAGDPVHDHAPALGGRADPAVGAVPPLVPAAYVSSVRRRYAFLDDLVSDVPPGAVRRAAATIARLSDA
jgi:sugar/nucleoside kinase (ribokinase family)